MVVAFGMVLGLVTAPSSSDLLRKQRASLKYTATNTLEAATTTRQALPRLILEATTGAIPGEVAKELGDTNTGSIVGVTGPKASGSTKATAGASLSGRVSIGGTDVAIDADGSSGAVHVKATDQRAKRAEAVANAFGNALVKSQHDKAQQTYQQEWVTLDGQRQTLAKQANSLGATSAAQHAAIKPGEPLPPALQQIDTQLSQVERQLGDVLSQLGLHFLHPPPTAPLVHLGTSPAIREAQSSSLGPPTGRKMRVLFFAGIALLAAIALAALPRSQQLGDLRDPVGRGGNQAPGHQRDPVRQAASCQALPSAWH